MTPECRYGPGDRVRLSRPDNPRHPAKGKAGVVTATHYREPKFKWDRGVPRLTVPGAWFVEILFRRATAEDWQKYRTIDDVWHVLETEVSPCDPGPRPPAASPRARSHARSSRP